MKYIGQVLLVVLLLCPISAIAQLNKQKPKDLKDVGVTERLGEQIPLNLTFANAQGDSISLKELFADGKPVLLNPVYYECPQLCTMVQDGIYKSIKGLKWNPGSDYNIITFSIDPTEGAELALKDKQYYVDKLDRQKAGQGWHFLTGPEHSVQQLASSIGFNYKKLENSEFAHGAAIMFLSPEGTITRYLYGLNFKEFDMRNALYDAADGNIGSTVEQVLLYCYQYDPDSNSYVPVAWRFMQIGGFATMFILSIFLGFMWVRHRYSNNSKQTNNTNGPV